VVELLVKLFKLLSFSNLIIIPYRIVACQKGFCLSFCQFVVSSMILLDDYDKTTRNPINVLFCTLAKYVTVAEYIRIPL
jgi:hypothetical protein